MSKSSIKNNFSSTEFINKQQNVGFGVYKEDEKDESKDEDEDEQSLLVLFIN